MSALSNSARTLARASRLEARCFAHFRTRTQAYAGTRTRTRSVCRRIEYEYEYHFIEYEYELLELLSWTHAYALRLN